MVANPAHGQSEKGYSSGFSLSPFVPEHDGLAKQVQLSRPALACSSATSKLNLAIVHGFLKF